MRWVTDVLNVVNAAVCLDVLNVVNACRVSCSTLQDEIKTLSKTICSLLTRPLCDVVGKLREVKASQEQKVRHSSMVTTYRGGSRVRSRGGPPGYCPVIHSLLGVIGWTTT